MWNKNNFEEIWENIIKQSLLYFCNKLGVKHKPLFIIKYRMQQLYNRYQDAFIKGNMYLDTQNIDRHKISACVAKAILVTKPLYIPLFSKIRFVCSDKAIYETTPSLIEDSRYFMFLNEFFAIEVVVSILESYIASDKREDRFRHKMVLPEPFPVEDNDYLVDVCIGLHNCRSRSFNTVAFANTLFLWEKYSCRKTRCDNLEKFCEKKLIQEGFSEEEANVVIKKAEFGEA